MAFSLYSATTINMIIGCLAKHFAVEDRMWAEVSVKSATLARLLGAGWTLAASTLMHQQA